MIDFATEPTVLYALVLVAIMIGVFNVAAKLGAALRRVESIERRLDAR